MRAGLQTAWDSGAFSVDLKVEVYRDATWHDLRNFYGYNWLVGASISDEVDARVMTAEVALVREQFKLSLSGLMSGSLINGSDALIRPGRKIRISVDLGAHLSSSSTWLSLFEGYIDACDFGANPMRVSCRDLGADLQDTFIERERVYGVAGAGCLIWEAGMMVSLNDYCVATKTIPASGSPTGYAFKATAITAPGGPRATGATEPSWPTSFGSTVSDNGITWTNYGALSTTGIEVSVVLQNILNANGFSALSLWTPTAVSPTWNIKPYLCSRQSVMDALNQVAETIGWSVRYAWKESASAWSVRFASPNRAKTVADRSFAPSQYQAIPRIAISREAIRNVVDVVYFDSADLIPGTKSRRKKRVQVKNDASIAKNGRRFCEIFEGTDSPVDSLTEATTMATNACSDLCEPYADCEVDLPFFPWVELGDLYELGANDVLMDAGTKLAVVAYRHELGPGVMRTSLTCRSAAPVGFHERWFPKMQSKATRAAKPNAPTSVTVASLSTSGPFTISWNPPGDVQYFNVYVAATSSAFTPSSSNFIGRTDGNSILYARTSGSSTTRMAAVVAVSDNVESVPTYSATFTG